MSAPLPLGIDPGIHTIPDTGASATPQSALGVITQATGLSTGISGDVATALTGAGGTGDPFSALAAFGQAALSAISNIGQLIIQLGETAIDGVVSIITDVIQGIADIFDAIFSAFTGGIFGGGASKDQALGAMTATQDTIENTAKAVQALENQAAADSNNGVSVFIDFTGDADSSTLTDFDQTSLFSASTIGISGGRAVQLGAAARNSAALALYSPQPTNTDYQIVSAIFGSAPAESGYVVLIGRSNDSLTTFVYAVISWPAVTIYNVVSGTPTQVATRAMSPEQFYAGAAYSLQCGIAGTPNTYEVKLNGATLLVWVDTANVTNVGEDYRYCGFGLGQNTGAAGQCAAFGFNDNAPGALIGDMFRAHSTNSALIQVPTAVVPQVALPGYYDAVELASSSYTYDPTTNTLTVSKSGIYMVEVSAPWFPPASGATIANFGAAIFKNGELYRVGQEPAIDAGYEPISSLASDTFIVQIDAGDFLQPGWLSYASPTSTENTLIGDATGTLAIFSCALLNTGSAAS